MIKSQGIKINNGILFQNIPGKNKWHAMGWGFSVRKYKAQHPRSAVTLPEEQKQGHESKNNLKVTAGKISQVTEFLSVMLLSDAEGSKAKLFLAVDKGRGDRKSKA